MGKVKRVAIMLGLFLMACNEGMSNPETRANPQVVKQPSSDDVSSVVVAKIFGSGSPTVSLDVPSENLTYSGTTNYDPGSGDGFTSACFLYPSWWQSNVLKTVELIQWKAVFPRSGESPLTVSSSDPCINATRYNGSTIDKAKAIFLKFRVVTVATVSSMSVTLSGPSFIATEGDNSWEASVANGPSGATYSYEWSYSTNSGSSWTGICSSDASCTRSISLTTSSFLIRVSVTATTGQGTTTSSAQRAVSIVTLAEPSSLNLSVTGPTTVGPYFYCSNWQALVQGGAGGYQYEWSGILSGQGAEISGTVYSSGDLQIDVTDAQGSRVSMILQIVYDPYLQDTHWCE